MGKKIIGLILCLCLSGVVLGCGDTDSDGSSMAANGSTEPAKEFVLPESTPEKDLDVVTVLLFGGENSVEFTFDATGTPWTLKEADPGLDHCDMHILDKETGNIVLRISVFDDDGSVYDSSYQFAASASARNDMYENARYVLTFRDEKIGNFTGFGYVSRYEEVTGNYEMDMCWMPIDIGRYYFDLRVEDEPFYIICQTNWCDEDARRAGYQALLRLSAKLVE